MSRVSNEPRRIKITEVWLGKQEKPVTIIGKYAIGGPVSPFEEIIRTTPDPLVRGEDLHVTSRTVSTGNKWDAYWGRISRIRTRYVRTSLQEVLREAFGLTPEEMNPNDRANEGNQLEQDLSMGLGSELGS